MARQKQQTNILLSPELEAFRQQLLSDIKDLLHDANQELGLMVCSEALCTESKNVKVNVRFCGVCGKPMKKIG